MGIDEDFAEVSNVESTNHFQAMTVTQKEDNFVWRLIHVYGPVQSNQKQSFLDNLENLIRGADIPTLVGGDFNLVRRAVCSQHWFERTS
jgi:endonuclease/exonuclease/phosphatase (EEP) superfamily protein YafD